jgi:hypothetical protein
MKRSFTSIYRCLHVALIIMMASSLSYSQTPTFREWWRQKKVTREYMAKQIALLQLQLENIREGYKIVSAGLTTIANIRNGDFNLHRDFFSALKNVKPSIANSAKVIDILAFQASLLKEASKVKRFCKTNANLSATEIRYVTAIYTNLVKLSDANASELLTLITANQVQMSDDERMQRIEKVHAEANQQLTFARNFGNELHVLTIQRSREQSNINGSKKLNAAM